MKYKIAIIGMAVLALGSCAKSTEQVSTTSDFGKSCELEAASLPSNKGMQCYHYGESSNRKAIWIIPDLHYISNEDYSSYITDWKTYASPDGSFTLKYPPTGFVDDVNWKNMFTVTVSGTKASPGEATQGVSVTRFETNSVTIEDRIKQIEDASSAMLRMDIDLNGSQAVRIDSLPKDSLSGGRKIEIFVQKDGYYLDIQGGTAEESPAASLFNEAAILAIQPR